MSGLRKHATADNIMYPEYGGTITRYNKHRAWSVVVAPCAHKGVCFVVVGYTLGWAGDCWVACLLPCTRCVRREIGAF